MNEGAKKLGQRLVGEGWGAAEGLGDLLASLRALAIPDDHVVFGIPELDRMLATPLPAQSTAPAQHGSTAQSNTNTAAGQTRSDDDAWVPPSNPPPTITSTSTATPMIPDPTPTRSPSTPQTHVLELLSPPSPQHPSPAGKSSLLHLLTTHTILPPTLLSIPLSGLARTIIIVDPLHHFSILRLSDVLLTHIATRFHSAGHGAKLHDLPTKAVILECLKTSLSHVHLLHPTGWPDLLATLDELDAYAFDAAKHRSSDRRVHALVLEDLHVFTPQMRAESGTGHAASGAAAALGRRLSRLAAALKTNLVLTSVSPFPFPVLYLSATGAQFVVTRVLVQRVAVRKFAPGMSVLEAWREREMRWEVVRRRRFVCKRIGGRGVVGGRGDGKEEGGFVFCVERGVKVEKEGDNEVEGRSVAVE